MLLKKIDNIYIYLLLILLVAFGLRYYGFHHPHNHTFDERAYAVLGYQLSQDLTDYNTQVIYRDNTAAGRKLPIHYDAPLFFHPPLYSLLISIVYRFFPPYFEIAHWVSFILGVLTLLLVFFLARLLFRDNRIAVFSAFLLAIESNHIICSEKIWMEATLAFFMTLALLCFVLGEQKNDKFFILCGISSGLAMLTKAPSLVVLIAFFLYGFLFRSNLLKNKNYLSIFPIALVMYFPWLIWQFKVFRGDIINNNIFWKIGVPSLSQKWVIILIMMVLFYLLFTFKKKILDKEMRNPFLEKVMIAGICLSVLLLFFLPYIHVNLRRILDFSYVPINGWFSVSMGESWYFYFGRFLELCPLYIFSYLSIAHIFKKNNSLYLLLIYTACIFGFFIFWGNYQCRYVVSAVAPLVILAGVFLFKMLDWLNKKQGLHFFTIKVSLLGLTSLFIIKTIIVALKIALPNLTCYY